MTDVSWLLLMTISTGWDIKHESRYSRRSEKQKVAGSFSEAPLWESVLLSPGRQVPNRAVIDWDKNEERLMVLIVDHRDRVYDRVS